jgi:hypothetical protein
MRGGRTTTTAGTIAGIAELRTNNKKAEIPLALSEGRQMSAFFSSLRLFHTPASIAAGKEKELIHAEIIAKLMERRFSYVRAAAGV